MSEMNTGSEATAWRSRFLSAVDGLKLHIREIGDPASLLLPVICLPGLTRSTEDFEQIGARIAAQDQRRVLALDYRGRGLSDHDPNWRNYDLQVELRDLVDCLAAFGIGRAIFLGTSRGGLLTALIGLVRPEIVGGAILNDIGPVIEAQGLARIRSYVGKIPTPSTHTEGADLLRQMFGTQFPDETEASWLRFSQRSWTITNGKAEPRYDRNLMKPLAEIDLEKPMPDLWPHFETLKSAPMLVIRGELSDLLSASTAAEMVARHPNARLHTAAKQGHAPLLEDEPTIGAILDFIRACEAA